MKELEILELAKKREITPTDFIKILWKLSTNKSRLAREYYGSNEKPIRIFRSRIFSEKLPSKVLECSYPPEKITPLGRANYEKNPVFYASAGGPVTFVESDCTVNDIVIVSEFRIFKKLVVQEVGLLNTENTNSEYEKLLKEIFTSSDEGMYSYSSCIADHLMSGDMLHGIVYPSIASQNQSNNLALKVSFVDNSIKYMNSTAYKITAIPEKYKYEVEEFDFGVPTDEKILWKGRKKNHVIRKSGGQLKMVSTGWSWDAYDEDNMLVDPE